jgi:hypothetical protein
LVPGNLHATWSGGGLINSAWQVHWYHNKWLHAAWSCALISGCALGANDYHLLSTAKQ